MNAMAAVEKNAVPTMQAALASGRCPICFLMRAEEFQEICRWVGGNVADENNLRQLDQTGGFCNHHFWLLADLHSAHSGSLLNAHVAGRFLTMRVGPAEWLRTAASRCALCARLASCEATHLQEFAGWLREPNALDEYERAFGLCLPHLLRCQVLIEDKAICEKLFAAQIACIERLQTQMGELARKFSAQHGALITSEEWDAWRRIIEKLVGRKNVRCP